jgi:hypothetical protein
MGEYKIGRCSYCNYSTMYGEKTWCSVKWQFIKDPFNNGCDHNKLIERRQKERSHEERLRKMSESVNLLQVQSDDVPA